MTERKTKFALWLKGSCKKERIFHDQANRKGGRKISVFFDDFPFSVSGSSEFISCPKTLFMSVNVWRKKFATLTIELFFGVFFEGTLCKPSWKPLCKIRDEFTSRSPISLSFPSQVIEITKTNNTSECLKCFKVFTNSISYLYRLVSEHVFINIYCYFPKFCNLKWG